MKESRSFYDADVTNQVFKEELEKMTVDELIKLMHSTFIYDHRISKKSRDKVIEYILYTRKSLCIKFGKVV